MELPESDWFIDEDYWKANRSFIWSKKRLEMSEAAAAGLSRLLEMKPGESILDLACGFGRYSIPLAKMGYTVTGIDINPDFVKEASGKASELNLNAHFRCADMREFSEPDGYANIIIMYNSFGYFQDPGDDRKVIDNCFRSLKPGGKLLLQEVTRDFIVANIHSRQSRNWFEETDGTIRLEENNTNEDWTWSTTKWILIKGSERREFTYGMRIYSTAEYIELFSSAGFENPETFGGISGRPYNKEKDHLVLVVSKPGK